MYNAKKISNSFAKYFSEVGKKFADKIPASSKSITDYLRMMGNNTKSIFLSPTEENEIRKIASELPTKSSSGYDNVSNVLLKEIIVQIVEPLSCIFNHSMQTGEFPDSMKLAEVIPLYKSKEHYLECNYRPISLLTTISKILEKIVYKRVYDFLVENCQLYENQFGFRSNHSCKHAIGQTVGTLLKNMENQKNSVCVLLDLSKAFDTIEHSIILKKLELYGIRGLALTWFQSYLSNRCMRVKCKTLSFGTEVHSEVHNVEYGTPQRSCLGPLIFLIFVNDLHLHLVDSECVQFADDTTLIFSHRNLNYLCFCIEQELYRIRDWFNANKLTLNIDKSSYLLFPVGKSTDDSFRLSLNGFIIPRVSQAKFLGTWLDDKLSWDTHVSKLIVKLKCGLGMLRSSKILLSRSSSTKRLLYFGQIHSNLCYCLGVSGLMLSKKACKNLAQLQRAAVSLINPNMCMKEVFKKYGILKFEKLVQLEQLKIGYKLCNSLLLVSLVAQISYDHKGQSTSKNHRYHTRNKQISNLPLVHNSKYKSSFLFCAVKEYSAINGKIQESKTLNSFARKCKKYLLQD